MVIYKNGTAVMVGDQVMGMLTLPGNGDLSIVGRVVRVCDQAPIGAANVLVAYLDWRASNRRGSAAVATAPDGTILVNDGYCRHECRVALHYAHAVKLRKVG